MRLKSSFLHVSETGKMVTDVIFRLTPQPKNVIKKGSRGKQKPCLVESNTTRFKCKKMKITGLSTSKDCN